MVEFDHLINKKKIEEEDDIKNLVTPNSRVEYDVMAEGLVRNLPVGTHFQFERRGMYIVD